MGDVGWVTKTRIQVNIIYKCGGVSCSVQVVPYDTGVAYWRIFQHSWPSASPTRWICLTGLLYWCNEKIRSVHDIDHIDRDVWNHENIRVICRLCHSVHLTSWDLLQVRKRNHTHKYAIVFQHVMKTFNHNISATCHRHWISRRFTISKENGKSDTHTTNPSL